MLAFVLPAGCTGALWLLGTVVGDSDSSPPSAVREQDPSAALDEETLQGLKDITEKIETAPRSTAVNQENSDRLTIGMTLEESEAILGPSTKMGTINSQGQSAEAYAWVGTDSQVLSALFVDGKLFSKEIR